MNRHLSKNRKKELKDPGTTIDAALAVAASSYYPKLHQKRYRKKDGLRYLDLHSY